jgi:hypothetical protein
MNFERTLFEQTTSSLSKHLTFYQEKYGMSWYIIFTTFLCETDFLTSNFKTDSDLYGIPDLHRLLTGPKTESTQPDPIPNSSMFVLPRIKPPACLKEILFLNLLEDLILM